MAEDAKEADEEIWIWEERGEELCKEMERGRAEGDGKRKKAKDEK